MLSTGSNFSFARKGIKYGAAASLSIITSLIPNLVHSQTLEELDVPLRPPMQVPICGKIESKTTFALPDAGAKQPSGHQSAQQPVTARSAAINSGFSSGKSIATKTATKTPVGSFNQAGHVKEYSWLSDDTTVEDEPALKATTVASTKSAAEATAKASVKVTSSATKAAAAKAKAKIAEEEQREESPSAEENRSTTAQTAKENSKSHETSATVAKKERIDPSNVKVATKPHCSGIADYYADVFHGRKTASGQLHDREKFTAAHRTLPFGTKLKVVNRNTGKACIVTVNDRGPFTKSRIIDLSCAAAKELGLMTAKSRLVDCYIVENE
jgi:rare lipoprotein A